MEPVVLKSNDDVLVERIYRTIEENINDSEFNVEALCKEVGISRTHLHRKMKEILGTTASELIRDVRLRHACELLEKGGVDISQIAYAVGYNNPAHFSTTFKKHFGVSPSEYQMTHLQQ